MVRPRSKQGEVRDALIGTSHGLSWKQVKEKTGLSKSTVTAILHRMVEEQDALTDVKIEGNRPMVIYHLNRKPHWMPNRHHSLDRKDGNLLTHVDVSDPKNPKKTVYRYVTVKGGSKVPRIVK